MSKVERTPRPMKIQKDVDDELILLVGHHGHVSINDVYNKAAKAYLRLHTKEIAKIKAGK